MPEYPRRRVPFPVVRDVPLRVGCADVPDEAVLRSRLLLFLLLRLLRHRRDLSERVGFCDGEKGFVFFGWCVCSFVAFLRLIFLGFVAPTLMEDLELAKVFA